MERARSKELKLPRRSDDRPRDKPSSAPSPAPTRVPVRGRAGGNAVAAAEAIAAAGVDAATQPLPHIERIQAAFGAHDVRGVRTQIGGNAAVAAARLDAIAYAIGDRIGFQEAPDLRLAAHEAAHTVQQRAGVQYEEVEARPGDPHEQQADAVADAVVAGRSAEALLGAPVSDAAHAPVVQRQPVPYVYDPLSEKLTDPTQETKLEADEQAELDQILGWRADGAMPVTVHADEPTLFVVPADAMYEEIAAALGNDTSATQTDWFEITPADRGPKPPDADHKVVRVRVPALLSTALAAEVRSKLAALLQPDVTYIIDELKPWSIALDVQWELVRRVLVWGDRSEWTDATGRSYFDLLLDRLSGTTLTEPDWYTFGQTSDSQTALEWLLDNAGFGKPMLREMIEMRSTHHLPGVSIFKGANLADGSPLGYAFTEGYAATIVVVERLAVAPTMAKALLLARNSPYLGHRVVVPSTGTEFFVYAAKLVLAPATPATAMLYQTNQRAERYVFRFPGTAILYPDAFSSTQPVGTDKDKTDRGVILFEAITAAQDDPKALMGLDLDVLAEADLASRKEIFRIVLENALDQPGAFGLLARVLLSTPSGEFLALEKELITPAMVKKLAYQSGSGRALLGRAYTMKALELRPLGASSLDNLPVYTIGQSGDYKWWVDVFPEEVQSEAVAPDKWGATDATTIGHEPATEGEAPGPKKQTGLRLRGTEHYTPWYGFGSYADSTPKSDAYHPSQLLHVVFKGTDAELIASAFEVAMVGPVTSPWREIFLPGIMKVANLWMMYAGARGFIGGMTAAAAMTRGLTGAELALAEEAAAALVSKTIRKLLFDIIVLGGSTAINVYREDLQKTPEGRAFVMIADIAFLGLAARDIYRLFSSGVLTKLIASAGDAIKAMGAAAPQRLLELYDGLRAFSTAMTSVVKRGLVKLWKTTTGHAMPVPTDEPGFINLFRTTRAELAGERVIAGLATSGRATKTAEDVLARLKAVAADAEDFAKAYSAVARRAARLAPDQVNLFLKRVAAVLDARRVIAGKLGGFLTNAMRYDDALAALAQAEKLVARAGLSDEAVAVLAKKAGANTIDVAWFNELDLDIKRLDFLARDSNTPWRLFKRAVDNPFDIAAREAVDKALRGSAGEMVAEQLIPDLLPRFTIAGRQAAMRSSIIDFLLRAPGRTGSTVGLEVKAWNKSIWDDIGSALYKRRVSHKAMTDSEQLAVEMFDGLVDQLSNAKSASRGAEPYLMMTKSATKETVDEMLRFLHSKGVKPEILRFDESLLNTVIDELERGLSLKP